MRENTTKELNGIQYFLMGMIVWIQTLTNRFLPKFDNYAEEAPTLK